TGPGATGRPRAWSRLVHRSVRAPADFSPAGEVPPRAGVSSDGDVRLLCVPVQDAGLCLIVGRHQGAKFHPAELDSVVRLVEVVAMLAPAGEATAVG
ncbi:hypothetical protein, partial [Spongiactinospora gelatinilytica]|uniref:hypothetical protein n=1 Tax=Spongiactinospora gelatinilytica TaxID=2666298 RepID=UPI003F668470